MKKLVLFLLVPSVFLADGVIIPILHRTTPAPIYLNLEYHKAKAIIEENAAQVGIDEIFERELRFPERSDYPFLPRLWAKRRVGYLLDEIRLHGEDKELVDEIVELGKQYGIVTPYTSFLVREEELVQAPGTIPTGRPLTFDTGRGVFETANALARMKRQTVIFSEGEKALPRKVVGDKVFYLKDGVWVNREYSEEFDEKVLVTWSDEFMDFLRGHPEVGRYVSFGGEVIFIYEGVAYRIES